MSYEWQEYDSTIKITCKAGTLSSGATSTRTISLGGANPDATGDNIMDVSDALASVITTPVLEVLLVNRFEAIDPEAEVGE